MGQISINASLLLLISVSAFAETPDYNFQRGSAKPVASPQTPPQTAPTQPRVQPQAKVSTREETPTERFNTFTYARNGEAKANYRGKGKDPKKCGFWTGEFKIQDCDRESANGALKCAATYTNPDSGGLLGGIQSVNPFSAAGKDVGFKFEVKDPAIEAYLCSAHANNAEKAGFKRTGKVLGETHLSKGLYICDVTGAAFKRPSNGAWQRAAGLTAVDALKTQAADFIAAKGNGKSADELLASCGPAPRAAKKQGPQMPTEPKPPLPIPPGGPNEVQRTDDQAPPPPAPVPAPKKELPAPQPVTGNEPILGPSATRGTP